MYGRRARRPRLDNLAFNLHDRAMEPTRSPEDDVQEVDAWLESLDGLTRERGAPAAGRMLSRLIEHGQRLGLTVAGALNTPYVNTIPADVQPAYPGDRSIERRITALIRWNAMAIVVKAHQKMAGIGRHKSNHTSPAAAAPGGLHSLLLRPY